MTPPTLDARLSRRKDMTPAEKRLAGYFSDHLAMLPFESVASIAEKMGMSEMTVIRFIRTIGYKNFKELKNSLRGSMADALGALDDRWSRFQVPPQDEVTLTESLRLEVAAITDVYKLANSAIWPVIIRLLAWKEAVYVTGFQASKGLALDFANRLKYARGGVRFVEGVSGTYAEILAEPVEESALVLIDTAAYSRHALRLADRSMEMGLPLVIVTDRFSDWPHEYTDNVLQVSTRTNTFWDSPAGIAALLNLLVNAIAAELGERAEERLRRMFELGTYFDTFTYADDMQRTVSVNREPKS